MRLVRRLAVVTAALGITLAALTGSTGVASADTGPGDTTTPGAHTYTFTDASTGSSGTMQWNNSTWALTLTATTGTLPAGTCVTAYFDWRSSGHHDARALRDCESNTTYSYSFTDSNPSNLVAGVNRMGLCKGTDNTAGTCTYYNVTTTPQIPMNWTPWPQPTWTNPCVLSWTKLAGDGTVTTFIDPHPQKRAAGTC